MVNSSAKCSCQLSAFLGSTSLIWVCTEKFLMIHNTLMFVYFHLALFTRTGVTKIQKRPKGMPNSVQSRVDFKIKPSPGMTPDLRKLQYLSKAVLSSLTLKMRAAAGAIT